MRFMILIKATKDSEAGVMPSEQLLTEMGNFNEELVKAGVMLAGEGLHPSSKGAPSAIRSTKYVTTGCRKRGSTWRARRFSSATPKSSMPKPAWAEWRSGFPSKGDSRSLN